jgi:hypothetical protein
VNGSGTVRRNARLTLRTHDPFPFQPERPKIERIS